MTEPEQQRWVTFEVAIRPLRVTNVEYHDDEGAARALFLENPRLNVCKVQSKEELTARGGLTVEVRFQL